MLLFYEVCAHFRICTCKICIKSTLIPKVILVGRPQMSDHEWDKSHGEMFFESGSHQFVSQVSHKIHFPFIFFLEHELVHDCSFLLPGVRTRSAKTET